MKVDSFKCDCCATPKGSSNHWFKIGTDGNGIGIVAWNTETKSDNIKHLCSDACVIKTVQAWLSEQKELSQKGETA